MIAEATTMKALRFTIAFVALIALIVPVQTGAQPIDGFRRYDPEGADRPPGPVPNARKGKRRVYEPVVGKYPRCTGLMWSGTRCRLSTGQVCTVYAHGLDNCI
jgi:hypothetical protein